MSEPTDGWSTPGPAGTSPTGPPPPGHPAPPPPAHLPPAWQSGPVWGAPPPPQLKPGVVPLRPLGVGELLDGAFSVVRGYWRPALAVSFVVAAVTTVASVLVVLAFSDFLGNVDQAGLEEGDLGALAGSLGSAGALAALGAVLSFVGGIVVTGCLAALCGRAVLGQPMDSAAMWAEVRPRLGPLVGASLLGGLLAVLPLLVGGAVLAGGIAVAGVPGGLLGGAVLLAGIAVSTYLYIRFTLVPAVVVLEKAGVSTALRRTGVLVTSSFWRLLGIILLAGVIASIVAGIIALPISAFAGSGFGGEDISAQGLVIDQVAGGLATAVVAPFSAAVSALLYIDRRMRAEGLDVALAAAAAEQPVS